MKAEVRGCSNKGHFIYYVMKKKHKTNKLFQKDPSPLNCCQNHNSIKPNNQQINKSWVLYDYWFAPPTTDHQELYFQPQSNIGQLRAT